MKNTKEEIKDLIQSFKDYLALRSDLLTLQFKRTSASIIGNISASLTTLTFASMAFLFGSFALAYVLSDYFQSYSKGFLTITIIYILLAFISWIFRKKISNKISDNIINQLFKEDNDEEDYK